MIETSFFDKRWLSLKDPVYLGYYYRHDLIALAKQLTDKKGTDVMANLQSHANDPGYSDIHKLWQDANYNTNAMQWINYYPGLDFDQALVDDVAFYLRLKGVHRSWISRVDPGYFAPLHWDVDDNESEYLKHGDIKRYSITMCAPTIGHVYLNGTITVLGILA